ncbi:hypothetical protein EXU85_32700 [Spirosoma sp. KCTC 42546]|uniref:hypothetical protein n=1 Tax=Spirosoma sp. KCTC 42546 TaxID=2520506 RepID=UPI001157F33B|nr:hypothetical protein [Spirosoma sp. KCTC 42546]QDK83108.1 hypothetical protein EXU85_32700 [Spirosoma sp. KCTC 42546]
MKETNTLYELLRSEEFRRRPAMFIGKLSILQLASYINGYRKGLSMHSIIENNSFDETAFSDLVAKYYDRPVPAQAGWALTIWAENYADETQSFMMFFLLFDELIGEVKEHSFYYNLSLLYQDRLKQEEIIFD